MSCIKLNMDSDFVYTQTVQQTKYHDIFSVYRLQYQRNNTSAVSTVSYSKGLQNQCNQSHSTAAACTKDHRTKQFNLAPLTQLALQALVPWALPVTPLLLIQPGSGVPRIFFGGGGSTNSVEDRGERERGSGGGSPLVSGSGDTCNLVQEISFHMVTFF